MEKMNRRDFLSLVGTGTAWAIFSGGCGKKGKNSANAAQELLEQTKPSDLKVLVVGIDGATFDIIKPMVKSGKLAQFKRLMDAGTHAKLRSQDPMLSPSLWTTIATGHNRDRHNIVHFLSNNSSKGRASTLISTGDRKTVALWNIASFFRKEVGVDGWWVTWPAEPVDGYVVSDRLAHTRWKAWTDTQTNRCLTFPDRIFERVKQLIVNPTKPPMEEIEKLVELTDAEKSEMLAAKKPILAHGLGVFKFGYCAQRTYENVALHMLEKGQPDLNMVFLIAVDPICHTFWHYFRPEQFPKGDHLNNAARLAKLIPAVYEHNDRYLSKLFSKVSSDTVVIVVSDHGFQGSGRLPRRTNVVDYRWTGLNRIDRLSRPVTSGMSGIHHIDGVFMVAGGPITRGAKFETQPSIADITPTILALMGLPVGKDMAGRVLEEIINPEFLSAHKVHYIDSYENYIDRRKLDWLPETGEKEQLEYLRSLGYID